MLKRFFKKETTALEIKAVKITKEELMTCFKDKRTWQYLVIDKNYHPRMFLDYYYYEECYEFFVTCRCVEVWDDEQNPWMGRLLFREGSRKYGTEEEVYAAIQKLGEELYVVDGKEYGEYVNSHSLAFWNHGNKTFYAGESVILKKHPLDYEDESRQRPEFEMRPGRLVYDIHGRNPCFRFDQPVVSYSIFQNGIRILEITSNIRELQNVNLEVIQSEKSEETDERRRFYGNGRDCTETEIGGYRKKGYFDTGDSCGNIESFRVTTHDRSMNRERGEQRWITGE